MNDEYSQKIFGKNKSPADSHFNQGQMAARARDARKALDDIPQISKLQKSRSPAVNEKAKRAAEFFAAVEKAYPPHFWSSVEMLKIKNYDGVETAIKFLEDDPWFFRSGYAKEEILYYIRKLDLSHRDLKRLEDVIINVVEKGDRREFRSYCKLAWRVASPRLRQMLELRAASDSPGIRRRVSWVLQAIKGKK